MMEKYRPGFEVWKVYKYFPLVVCVTVLTANSNLRSLEFKVLLVLFLPFCVYYHRGLSFFFFFKKIFLINFFQLPPLFNGHHSLFWSLKMALLLHKKLSELPTTQLEIHGEFENEFLFKISGNWMDPTI